MERLRIYAYNAWKEKKWLCTVEEFEKGKEIIVDSKTKRRVYDIPGCKRPKEV